MRIFLLLIFGLFLTSLSFGVAEQAGVIKDDVDAINYSFGFELGEKMQKQQVEFLTDAFSDGLYDAISKKVPRLDEDVMVQLLAGMAAANTIDTGPKHYRLPGDKFIGENSTKEGIVTLSSGLQYKVLKTGNGKKQATKNDTVSVLYTMKKIDGQVVGSTYPLGVPTPEEVAVNKGIPGWVEALMLMHEGDRWELYIPQQLAFRDVGPLAGQAVIVDLELLEIFSGGN